MINKESLAGIHILDHLTNEMLEKLAPHIEPQQYAAREIIFREGDRSEHFYMLKKGKVLLEKRISNKITVSIASIKAGFSFGWSAMLNEPLRLDAVCSESSVIYALNAQEAYKQMEADPHMGYLIYKELIRIVQRRLDLRTEQFARVISKHPHIEPLLDEE
ncbi:MAG TPA: cyclic nucleotide-binding domain-containing protein [Desulfosalsimonadaceae bacterium]|nr:cyclic nucleotide-binding domain-containing protein [Desulfosalsimonadaceae bacterium]